MVPQVIVKVDDKCSLITELIEKFKKAIDCREVSNNL